jgi:hypothetical protein
LLRIQPSIDITEGCDVRHISPFRSLFLTSSYPTSRLRSKLTWVRSRHEAHCLHHHVPSIQLQRLQQLINIPGIYLQLPAVVQHVIYLVEPPQ